VTIAIVGSAYDGSLNGFGYREICFTAKALDPRTPRPWRGPFNQHLATAVGTTDFDVFFQHEDLRTSYRVSPPFLRPQSRESRIASIRPASNVLRSDPVGLARHS
jgi:hypothetical protein